MEKPAATRRPSYAAVGHITIDHNDGMAEPMLGGTVAYSGAYAIRSGASVDIFTRCNRRDLGPFSTLPASLARLHLEDAITTTTFTNIEVGSSRVQYIDAWAGPITAHQKAVPCGILHLAPVAREIDVAAWIQAFEADLICLTAQGLIRHWHTDKVVHLAPLQGADSWAANIDLLVVSKEELPYIGSLASEMLKLSDRLVVVTEGESGVRIIGRGTEDRFAASLPRRGVVSTVGAGDVFASALFLSMHQTGNLGRSVNAALRSAADSITYTGIGSLP